MKTLIRPYIETIRVGTRQASGLRNLLAGIGYTHYSTPIDQPLTVCGFNANFEMAAVRLQLTDPSEPHVWVPFFQTPMDAIAGAFDDASPVLYLAAPYLMPGRHKIQIFIQNQTGADIINAQFSIISVRVDHIAEAEEVCRAAA